MTTPEPPRWPARRHPTPWFYGLSLLALLALGVALERMGDSQWVDEPNGLDVSVLAWVVRHRPAWPVLTSLFSAATRFGNPNVATLATAVVTFGLYALAERREAGVRRSEALIWLGSILGGQFLNLSLKEVFHRDRPPVVHRLVTETSYSFPSGHSVFAAVFFTMLAVLLARLIPPDRVGLRVATAAACLVLAVLVGLSRIWLAVHYPTDVLGGLLLGFGWVYLVCLVRRARSHWVARRAQDDA